MPADEYSVGGGGKLKLKGSKVNGGRIEKKKKKSKTTNQEPSTKQKEGSESAPAAASDEGKGPEPPAKDGSGSEAVSGVGKTEAERKHEEMRRKRLQERLKREGVKTHKERVEELNKYLSRLSEHHDMPKIGPG